MKKFSKKYYCILDLWLFLLSLIILIFFIELISPDLVLVYFNPLLLIILWFVLSLNLLFSN